MTALSLTQTTMHHIGPSACEGAASHELVQPERTVLLFVSVSASLVYVEPKIVFEFWCRQLHVICVLSDTQSSTQQFDSRTTLRTW